MYCIRSPAISSISNIACFSRWDRELSFHCVRREKSPCCPRILIPSSYYHHVRIVTIVHGSVNDEYYPTGYVDRCARIASRIYRSRHFLSRELTPRLFRRRFEWSPGCVLTRNSILESPHVATPNTQHNRFNFTLLLLSLFIDVGNKTCKLIFVSIRYQML